MDKKKPWDTESQFKKNRNITNITEISPESVGENWVVTQQGALTAHL